ncbi:MAG: hypothetical protein JWR16_1622 [Nevskia sp.]|nr:hypothetical protein [Nevskia sp.]
MSASASASGERHEGAAGSSVFASWRLLRASSDVIGDHTAATFELLILEWQEERARLLRLLLLTVVATACVLLLIGFAGLFLLAAVWETPLRIPVAAALLVAFASGAWLSWHKARNVNVSGIRPFTTLREELAKDRALFQSQTHEVR